MKLRAAVFAFTSCEGCSLMILNLERELLSLLEKVEFVNFREAVDERRDDYDLAIIDGAITRAHEVEELKKIRERARVLIAMGACAVQGGLYYLRNYADTDCAKKYVYGEKAESFEVMPVRPVSEYVPVDYNIYGCPVDRRELFEVISAAAVGRRPNIPDYPVCNECRMAENICVFERGLTCFGPITRAGCGAICPSFSTGCCGCRGPVSRPFIESYLRIMEEHGVKPEDVAEGFRKYNGWWAEGHEGRKGKG
jgi:coenzyme F420-reducing hydrogenase gamma subunit